MKQSSFMQIMLIGLTGVMISVSASAYDFKAENSDGVTIYYDIKGGNAEVTSGYYSDPEYSGVVNIPGSVTYNDVVYEINALSSSVFRSCSNLESVTIPNTVLSIGDYAFYGCTSLSSIIIPNSVKFLGNNAFYGCSSLISIKLSESLTKIENCLFEGCIQLTSIDIPISVTSIGQSAFSGCSSISSVVVPNSVNKIGDMAFYGCSSLRSIVLSNNLTKIENSLFSGCTLLGSIDIPSGVTSIEQLAFFNCYSLVSVRIPGSVTSIGSNAFKQCSSIKAVVSMIKDPFIINTFDWNDKTAILYVPVGSKNSYMTMDGWKRFTNIIEIEDESQPMAYAAWCKENTTLYFFCSDELILDGKHDGQNITNIWGGADVTDYYDKPNDFPGWYDIARQSATKAVFEESFNIVEPKSTYTWFAQFEKLTSITGLEFFNTEKTTTMQAMFAGCSSLGSIDVSHFNTSNVVNMKGIFAYCSKILRLDLSNFDTRKVTNMDGMFQTCPELRTLTVGSDWSTASVESSEKMFLGCTNILGSRGTTYDANYVDATYARVDREGLPGYLTGEVSSLSTSEFVALRSDIATFCPSDAVDFSVVDGLKAYVAVGFSRTSGEVLLRRVNSVPANTGVVLVGTAGKSYEIPYATTDEITANLLTGVTTDGTKSRIYVISDGAFVYKSNEETIVAGTAYLALPGVSTSNLKLRFDEEADTNKDGVVDVADIATVISVMAGETEAREQTFGE